MRELLTAEEYGIEPSGFTPAQYSKLVGSQIHTPPWYPRKDSNLDISTSAGWRVIRLHHGGIYGQSFGFFKTLGWLTHVQ